MKQFISWRRVSTQKQGASGLGLEAQKNIIDYFVESEKGELIADFCEVYTGTELSGCIELRKAISKCKETGATLIIAKSDRFRSTVEALQILEEVGEKNIFFCDLPHTDKFTLTLFFAIAEREALLISLRTKAALTAKKERGELTGGSCRKEKPDMSKAVSVAAEKKKEGAKSNPHNIAFAEFIEYWQAKHGKITANTDFKPIAEELNRRGKKTAKGMDFNALRARAMFTKIKSYDMI